MLRRIIFTTLSLLMLTGVSFAGWGVVDVPVAHAAAGDTTWTYYGLLPSCVPCTGKVDANGKSDCQYPGDIGEWRYATYTLDGVIEFMLNIMRFIFSIAGSLALLFVVWGGFQMMASAGQSKMVEAGRKTLVNALIGVLLIFGAYTGVNFFIGGLVNGKLEATNAIGGIKLWEYTKANVCQKNTPANKYIPPTNANMSGPGFATCPATKNFPVVGSVEAKTTSYIGDNPACSSTCAAKYSGQRILESVDSNGSCCCYVTDNQGCDGSNQCGDRQCDTSTGKCTDKKAAFAACGTGPECASGQCFNVGIISSGKCLAKSDEVAGYCCWRDDGYNNIDSHISDKTTPSGCINNPQIPPPNTHKFYCPSACGEHYGDCYAL